MHEKLKRKLRSRAGESIAEVLVALLIAALAMATLAGMIGATYSMVEKSKSTMKDYVGANNALVDRANTAEAGTGTVSLKIGDAEVSLSEGATGSVSVVFYGNDEVGGTVTAYAEGEGSTP